MLLVAGERPSVWSLLAWLRENCVESSVVGWLVASTTDSTIVPPE